MDFKEKSKKLISNHLVKKLLPQYRHGKLLKEIDDQMYSDFRGVWFWGFSAGEKSKEKKFEGYIPKPKGSFKNRLMFLFWGKF